MAINQSMLITKAAAFQDALIESKLIWASEGKVNSAFLCHSHMDDTLVKGLIAYLKESGTDLYIDWKDHAMPESPNGTTAKRIQEAIKARPLFFFSGNRKCKSIAMVPLGNRIR